MIDYEKEYKQIFNKAKTLHKMAVETNHKNTSMCLEELFPELAESEDEKIRKAINVILLATEDDQCDFYTSHKLTRQQLTDWLDKQKVSKEDDTWPNLSNCKHDCKSCQGKCFYRKEPYQETKTNDEIMENIRKEGNLKPSEIAWIESLRNKTIPAWTDEDEGFRQLLLNIMEAEHPGGLFSTGTSLVQYFGCNAVPVKRITDWLESLSSKAKENWSENDQAFLQRVISVVKWAACCTDKYKIINPDGAAELVTWLEKLKK